MIRRFLRAFLVVPVCFFTFSHHFHFALHIPDELAYSHHLVSLGAS